MVNTVISEPESLDPYSRLIDKHELANHLKISWRTVNAMMASRQIPVIRIGNRPRFRLRDVEKALERYTVREVSL